MLIFSYFVHKHGCPIPKLVILKYDGHLLANIKKLFYQMFLMQVGEIVI